MEGWIPVPRISNCVMPWPLRSYTWPRLKSALHLFQPVCMVTEWLVHGISLTGMGLGCEAL